MSSMVVWLTNMKQLKNVLNVREPKQIYLVKVCSFKSCWLCPLLSSISNRYKIISDTLNNYSGQQIGWMKHLCKYKYQDSGIAQINNMITKCYKLSREKNPMQAWMCQQVCGNGISGTGFWKTKQGRYWRNIIPNRVYHRSKVKNRDHLQTKDQTSWCQRIVPKASVFYLQAFRNWGIPRYVNKF